MEVFLITMKTKRIELLTKRFGRHEKDPSVLRVLRLIFLPLQVLVRLRTGSKPNFLVRSNKFQRKTTAETIQERILKVSLLKPLAFLITLRSNTIITLASNQ